MFRVWIALLTAALSASSYAEVPSSKPAPVIAGEASDEQSAIQIARNRGMTVVDSAELDGGIWEVKGRNKSGVFLEMRISSKDGTIQALDYGHPSPMRFDRGAK